ncbi:hypothetical protein PV703_28905, partial [Streptomyces sp. ME01-24h]|nr:hypothetical protein [Streptomyces sp. ME01-24h]
MALVGGGLTVAAIPHGGHGGRAHTAAGQPTPAGARTLPLSPIPARAGDDAAHRPGRPARSDAHAAPRGTALSAARTTVAADPAPRGATGPRARQGTAGTAPADAAPTYTAGRTTAPRTTTPFSYTQQTLPTNSKAKSTISDECTNKKEENKKRRRT